MSNFATFIPEVWSKKLAMEFDNSGVGMQVVNRNYEGEIKSGGDTVHIRKRGAVTIKDYVGVIERDNIITTDQTMVIDQEKYFSFLCPDIEKAQSNIDIMREHMEDAKVEIDLVKDTRILSHVANAHANNTISTSVVTKDNIYDKLLGAQTKLKLSNALTSTGRTKDGKLPWIIIDPELEKLLRQAPEFNQATSLGDKQVRAGSIGKMVAGFEVLVATNFTASAGTYNVMFGTNDAITFASQIAKVRTLPDPDSFATQVDGLYVYGSKAVNPLALGKLVLTLS